MAELKPLIHAQHGVPADLQQLYVRDAGALRRLKDCDSLPSGPIELDVNMSGGCRRGQGVGAGLSCPCFGCSCRACQVQ